MLFKIQTEATGVSNGEVTWSDLHVSKVYLGSYGEKCIAEG